ncbi:CorA metal ion transporter [Geranomyces variabilis]|nr:CorA metal ion transporter [Geranomyces variabilis]
MVRSVVPAGAPALDTPTSSPRSSDSFFPEGIVAEPITDPHAHVEFSVEQYSVPHQRRPSRSPPRNRRSSLISSHSHARGGSADSDTTCQAGALVTSPQDGLNFDEIAAVIGSSPEPASTTAEATWKLFPPPPAPRFMFYSQKTGQIAADSLEALAIPVPSDPVATVLQQAPFWIDVTDPTHSEMVTLSRLFGIHPLTSEDILTEDTREKCEIFRNYAFVVIRTFDPDEASASYMQPVNVSIVVLRECVLSFHTKPVEHTENVLKRIAHLGSYGLHITPDWLNYAIIDDITDGFQPLIKFIELEVDSIDDLVLLLKGSDMSDMLRRIGSARKKVMQLFRLLSTKADVLKTVIKRCGERLPADSETSLYLGDIQDHAITMVQNLIHFEKTLARAHSNYLAQISIEITVASNNTNEVVTKMTAMASMLLPLNVVTGLFGMNVHVPGQDVEGYGWFISIIVTMLVCSAAVWFWCRRHKLV